jgi:hypothetical protein
MLGALKLQSEFGVLHSPSRSRRRAVRELDGSRTQILDRPQPRFVACTDSAGEHLRDEEQIQ